MRLTLALFVAALVAATTALAAAAPTYWTPAKMASVSKGLPGPVYDSGAGSRPTFGTWSNCVGVGVARAGSYQGFRCSVAWKAGFSKTGTATMWLRPRAGGYCISSRAFTSCPLVAVASDPRVCRSQSSPSDHYAEYCAVKVAKDAVEDQVAGQTVNLACSVVTTFRHACKWTAGSAFVSFALVGGKWQTTVAVQ